MTKILDCTLRDGGYYTNWDFDSKTVDAYIDAMNALPVDYLEVGYRNNPSKEYMGKFGYSPVAVLKQIRSHCKKKIVVMLNEKDTTPDDLYLLINPIKGLADMIRIAIDPKNFDRAVILAKAVKSIGFEVGFNCMYMSKWVSEYPDFIYKLNILNGWCDLFCMVDSYGGVTPNDVRKIYKDVRGNTTVPVGFHGHNNLQLGLINTIEAINLGVDFVDATIMGMGRGAGNLNIELLLTYLNSHNNLKVDFNILGDIISVFTPLMEKYRWGTNLPYMLAGANKIPQKEVMDWVTNRVYSFNSIVRALENRKEHKVDNAKYPEYSFKDKFENVLVIGGGNTVIEHIDGIKEFLSKEKSIALVFATARHAAVFANINCPKYFALVGTESRRLSANVEHDNFEGILILPPYPRTMGTEVPDFAKDKTFELSKIEFMRDFFDSCTTIAMQIAINLSSRKVYTVGYDGYPGNVLSEKEMALTHENKTIFEAFKNYKRDTLCSLTPSLYKELNIVSIYQLI